MPGSKAWRDAFLNIQKVADSHPRGFLAPLRKGGDPLPGLRGPGIRGREHGRRQGCRSPEAAGRTSGSNFSSHFGTSST